MISHYDMSPGLHLPFYSRRLDRNCASQFFPWYWSPRHILCSHTFPLRIINRGCICYYRRICALISIILTQHHMSQNPLCNHIYRFKYNFLPTTFLRTIWYTMRYSDYPDTYTIWNTISSIGSFISITAVILIIFIIWEALTSKREVLTVDLTTTNLEGLNGCPPPYIWRTYICQPKIRKEGIEPPLLVSSQHHSHYVFLN